MKKMLIFILALGTLFSTTVKAQTDLHTLVFTQNTTTDTILKPLLGVIAGPIPSPDSPAPDLTPQLQDIGVTSIRNNGYWDDRLDIESIFHCPDTTVYPSWECDPYEESHYYWGPSDTLFQSFIDGGFEPFLRLGGETQCSVREHDFHGPQNETQENNWIVAAIKIADRYTHWQGKNDLIQYLDIFTEWPNKDFWDRSNPEFIHFWAKAFKAVKEAFPDYKVGGPGLLFPTISVIRGETTHNPAIDFLKTLYNQKLRPDWIGWHLWKNDPTKYYIAAHQYRDLLDGVGDFSSVPWAGTDFFKGVELICGAYGVDQYIEDENGNPRPIPREEMDKLMNKKQGAAVLTGQWIAMQLSDVERAYYYRAGDTYSDPSAGPNDRYMGWSGLFFGDPVGTYKPKAHAFRLWSQMVNNYPRMLATDFPSVSPSGTRLWALGGKGQTGYGVLLANTESQTLDYTLNIEGTPVRPGNFQVDIYQVDDTNNGRTPTRWTGGTFHIPDGTVQMLVLTPKTTHVEGAKFETPKTFGILSNYPNPFNGATTICFSLKNSASVRVEIFDLSGRKVATLLEKRLPAGENSVNWNGQNDTYRSVPSGTYLCRLVVNGKPVHVHKLIYLK